MRRICTMPCTSLVVRAATRAATTCATARMPTAAKARSAKDHGRDGRTASRMPVGVSAPDASVTTSRITTVSPRPVAMPAAASTAIRRGGSGTPKVAETRHRRAAAGMWCALMSFTPGIIPLDARPRAREPHVPARSGRAPRRTRTTAWPRTRARMFPASRPTTRTSLAVRTITSCRVRVRSWLVQAARNARSS